ncbi:TIGR03621 family F420-dependent LLM class oxidoreductase [Iamia sp. SCSIO 61187]|uniref:TIGR03621 family F420-dependent LLM class oxidoreductase n=1 Tax=Iamia sp. SCSIO 61187 TaxID=2722752 RepID=UPI001C62F53B|nr:TIGR03621 family F420-dependent LLM class oxidoreductase [Iamia sp. SCSIO 61187]QYG91407.1 TIGR03621 family F420-dependent LLM class oxidoreductase [Iamia sp. SCSIO 61187]
MSDVPILVSVQAQPAAAAAWLDLARRVDADGFATLYVADHPGSTPAPFVALAAAAAVTERVALGTCVANAGLWEPIALASEVATLDVVSGGRALLGLGAGHTPAEWAAVGRTIPSAGARVDRLEQVIDVVTRLLAGEEVTVAGPHVHAEGARLAEPRPVQDPVPLMVGGAGARVLARAAAGADVVGVTGMGRTRADGHRHEVAWSEPELERSFGALHAAIAAAGTAPAVEALVQHVEVTDDRRAAAERLAARIGGVDPDDVLDVPYVWIGTVDHIADQARRHRERWGVDRYVVRPPALDVATEVLRRL